MHVLFTPGSDSPVVDGQPHHLTGFNGLEMPGMKSIEFDFSTNAGVIKWNAVENFKVKGFDEKTGAEIKEKIGEQTPSDSVIGYDQFYAIASRDLKAWSALREAVNQWIVDERHAAESSAAMDEAESENARFDATPKAVKPETPAGVTPVKSSDDILQRVIEAHKAQAIKNVERAKNPKEKSVGRK